MRTKPLGKTYGRSISLFINNWQCHLMTLDVYADGAIDCWSFVDLSLFRGKLQTHWIVSAPKAGQDLSVFNFGYTGSKKGRWIHSSRNIAEEVQSVLRSLNPEMRNLLDMEGSDTEVRGKARYAKLGLSDQKPFRQKAATGGEILGDSVPILRVAAESFELTRLVIYADGLFQIGTVGELLPITELPFLYERGKVANHAPAGSKITLPGLGEFETTSEFGGIASHDRVAEVHDKLNELNGKPSVICTCAKVFAEYQQSPSPDAREALRQAYEAVPDHLRCYCGDMDTRDTAIRAILYEEQHESSPTKTMINTRYRDADGRS